MKLFWLGIALVIVSVFSMSKVIYELGYNAGLDDGKRLTIDSTGFHIRTWEEIGWKTGKDSVIYQGRTGYQSQHTKADSVLKANIKQP